MTLFVFHVLFSIAFGDPSPPTLPQRFKASLVLSLPYIDLDINLHVTQDFQRGLQKVEFFDGLQSEYLNAKTGRMLYHIYNMTERICVDSTDRHHSSLELVNIYPDLTDFRYEGMAIVRGLQCDKWYRHLARPGEWENFFFDPRLNRPVRWQMHSREPIFDSHIDDYIVDYISVHGLEDSHSFELPTACNNALSAESGGPTQTVSRSASLFHAFGGRVGDSFVGSFEEYVRRFNRRYNSADEYNRRQQIYYKNILEIQKMNENHNLKAKFAGNEYLDRTREEVMGVRGGKRKMDGRSSSSQLSLRQQTGGLASNGKQAASPELSYIGKSRQNSDVHPSLPARWDWRDYGASPPVKDQATCGSCWTFAVIGAIESRNYLSNGHKMDKLSEQFLLDCTWSGSNAACFGGNQDDAGRVILEKFDGFVPFDKTYGNYLSVDSYCKFVKGMDGIRIDGWAQVPSRNDEAIMRALVTHGLLSVSISAAPEVVFYRSGVISADSCADLAYGQTDHAVNLVGYGTSEEGVPYWLLRNSWSPYWGEKGYFRVERGRRDCGVSLDVSYPLIERKTEAASVVVYEGKGPEGKSPSSTPLSRENQIIL